MIRLLCDVSDDEDKWPPIKNTSFGVKWRKNRTLNVTTFA